MNKSLEIIPNGVLCEHMVASAKKDLGIFKKLIGVWGGAYGATGLLMLLGQTRLLICLLIVH